MNGVGRSPTTSEEHERPNKVNKPSEPGLKLFFNQRWRYSVFSIQSVTEVEVQIPHKCQYHCKKILHYKY